MYPKVGSRAVAGKQCLRVLVFIEELEISYLLEMDNMNRFAVLICEDFQSVYADFLQSLLTAKCIYVSAVVHNELLSFLREAQKDVSPDYTFVYGAGVTYII